jgi:hypothetical protein
MLPGSPASASPTIKDPIPASLPSGASKAAPLHAGCGGVVGVDLASGLGLLRAGEGLPVRPMAIGSAQGLVEKTPVVVAGPEGSRRRSRQSWFRAGHLPAIGNTCSMMRSSPHGSPADLAACGRHFGAHRLGDQVADGHDETRIVDDDPRALAPPSRDRRQSALRAGSRLLRPAVLTFAP